MKIILIVAMTEERVIGKNGSLPWHIPSDLKHFKDMTMGHPVLLGWNTFQSLAEKSKTVLPGRAVGVITSRGIDAVRQTNVRTFRSLTDGLTECVRHGTVFIAGGAQLYRTVLGTVDEMIVTTVYGDIAGDTYFPEYDQSQFIGHVIRGRGRPHHEDAFDTSLVRFTKRK